MILSVTDSPRARASLISVLFLALWTVCAFWPQSSPSPAAVLARLLAERFPGTPVNEAGATIEWGRLHKPSRLMLFSDQLSSLQVPLITGTSRWSSAYPRPNTIGPRPRRQWIRRLNWLKKQADAHDPDLSAWLSLPPGALQEDGYVIYPPSVNLGSGSDGACSWERTGCLMNVENGYSQHLDIIDADNGTWVINFDDGPIPPSKTLYKVLDRFNVKATHFWIGGNVLKHWDLALLASERGDHLAVHTWSHSHLTSLTDMQVLGELGWCIEIIADLTGKVPKYFRPPYGNIDNRIRAIAKYVFGLETVIWNYDSVDWGLNQTYATGDQVDKPDPLTAPTLNTVIQSIESYATQPQFNRTAGRLILEHELSEESVQAFAQSWPSVKASGWTTGTLPECIQGGHAPWYQ